MAHLSGEQEAIINLLNQLYNEMVVIEEKFGLIAGEGDMRPRIDYFHDAVRAFTAGGTDGGQQNRLSIEMLSYDLRCLRYIQQMPLSPFKKGGESLSPAQDMVLAGAGLIKSPNRPDRETKARISELYQNYAVLFAALLKKAADRDYFAKTDALNEDVQNIMAVIHQCEKNADISKIIAAAQHIEDDELRALITTFLHKHKHLHKDEIQKLIEGLKNQVKRNDANIKSVDKAHMDFAMAQLGIFEESRDMLKKFATQGLNLVGKFVENAVAETRRQMGGQGR